MCSVVVYYVPTLNETTARKSDMTDRLEKYFEGYKVISNDIVIGRAVREIKGYKGTSIKWLSVLADGTHVGESATRWRAVYKIFKALERRSA